MVYTPVFRDLQKWPTNHSIQIGASDRRRILICYFFNKALLATLHCREDDGVTCTDTSHCPAPLYITVWSHDFKQFNLVLGRTKKEGEGGGGKRWGEGEGGDGEVVVVLIIIWKSQRNLQNHFIYCEGIS